jgi:putative ABC transport system permease protein
VPEGNTLTAGQWWPKDYAGEPLVSVDADLGKALNLKLGDRITVGLLGVERTATIASFRQIDWENMGFNYVLVFSQRHCRRPHNLAATIELPARRKRRACAARSSRASSARCRPVRWWKSARC